MALFYHFKIKKLPKKWRKLLQRAKNRRLAIFIHTHRHHDEQRAASLMGSQRGALKGDTRVKPSGKRRAAARDRLRQRQGRQRDGRQRDRSDRSMRKSAQEEQLWQLKSRSMKERTRDRKREAMDRWAMTAVTGGSYRGV